MVILRELTIDDLSFLLEIRNDDSTRLNLENNSKFTLDECIKWFKSTSPKWFIIEVNNEKIGYVRTNGDEVGIDIHPNFRRRGYARKAYKYYLKDKDYASLWVFEDNFAKKLYESLGFTPTGESKIIRNKVYIRMEFFKK